MGEGSRAYLLRAREWKRELEGGVGKGHLVK